MSLFSKAIVSAGLSVTLPAAAALAGTLSCGSQSVDVSVFLNGNQATVTAEGITARFDCTSQRVGADTDLTCDPIPGSSASIPVVRLRLENNSTLGVYTQDNSPGQSAVLNCRRS